MNKSEITNNKTKIKLPKHGVELDVSEKSLTFCRRVWSQFAAESKQRRIQIERPNDLERRSMEQENRTQSLLKVGTSKNHEIPNFLRDEREGTNERGRYFSLSFICFRAAMEKMNEATASISI